MSSIWFGLVSLFKGIWTFVGYIMLKPFLQKNSSGIILFIEERDKGVHTFPKSTFESERKSTTRIRTCLLRYCSLAS